MFIYFHTSVGTVGAQVQLHKWREMFVTLLENIFKLISLFTSII